MYKRQVWGHNSHLMKKTSSGAFRGKVFGEFVFENFGDDMYCVGQYTGQGEIEHMPGQVRKLAQKVGFLEKYIVENIKDVCLYKKLDLPVFNDPIKHMVCGGENVEELILADHYHGVILHENGSTPTRF